MAPGSRLRRDEALAIPDTGARRLRNAGLGILGLLLTATLFYRTPALATNRAAAEGFAWVTVVGMLLVYERGYAALRSVADGPGSARGVFGFAAAFGLVALLIPPFHSIDVFCYINRGWQQAHYGLNPYLVPLRDTPGWRLDPMFRPEWVDATSPYGFLFEWAAWALCRLGGGSPAATLLLFKAAGLAVFLLTGLAVWRFGRALGMPRPGRALYLVLWNPLLIEHSLINGHNDLWMGLLSAVGVGLAATGGWLWALPALMGGTLVKYASAALMPFTALYLLRKHGRLKTGVGVGLAALLLAVSSWAYLPEDWGRLFRTQADANGTVQNSPAAMVLFPLELCVKRLPSVRRHEREIVGAVRALFWSGFVAFYAGLAWVRLRGRGYERAAYLRDCVLIQFVLICVVSPKYYAWYLGMFLPLAFWLPEGGRLRRVVMAVAAAHMLSLTFIAQSHFLNTLLMLVIPAVWAWRSWRPSPPFEDDRADVRRSPPFGRPSHAPSRRQ